MLAAHGSTGKMSIVNTPTVRDELAAILDETLRLQQRLMDDVRDDAVPVADLVAQVSVLERLDDRRDRLITQLRRTASAGMRPARTSPPVREILLETLAHFRWPQNAGFLEEYLLARHQLQLDSRAFAPLRRDERNAWDRAPGAREAYIAPALKPDGSANPRWLTRSDWDLERRVVATPRTERLFDLYKIYVLAGRPGSAEASYRGPRSPVDALLEKYAHDILDTEPPPPPRPRRNSARGVRMSANALAPPSGRSAGRTSRTASRSPASWLACPAVTAYGAGTLASRPESAVTGAPMTTASSVIRAIRWRRARRDPNP